MPTVPLLDAAADYKLAQYLSRRQGGAHLVAPADLLQAVRALAPQAPWSSSTTLDDVPAGKKRLFVYSPTDEAGLIQAARARFPKATVLGLMHHILPRLACSPTGRKGEISVESGGPPTQHFAVVCTPRTGSTFYCELLQAGGLGAAREHLRPALVHVLHQPGVDREALLREVLSFGQVHGLFGTKLISEFLFDGFGKAQAAAALACLHERGFRFIHLSRDLAEQAVSKYVAGRTDVWHVRGDVGRQQQAAIAEVPYDGPALRQLYDRARAETEALDAALATLPAGSVLRARYEDFTTEPLASLREAAAFLGRDAALPAVDFTTLPVRLSATAPSMQAMAQRLQSDLAGA
jgi:LPS sulfotransferase NodH